MDTGIWKEMVDGMHGSLFSMSNVIKLDLEGFTMPRVASKDFRYIGNILSTSRADMAIDVWAKSSTMI